MRRNVLIVEDKKSQMTVLSNIISEINSSVNIYTAFHAGDAYKAAMEHHIHLFIVDVILNPQNLGDVSGLRFAQEIRGIKKYKFSPIIFVSSLNEPKLFAYSHLHCYDYIEKPFDEAQIKNAVADALDFPVFNDEERCVYFRKDGIVYARKVKDIVYIECSRRKLLIHCCDDMLEAAYKTVSELLEELDSEYLIQCNRYTIVNRRYIEKIDYANRYITLTGMREQIEIGAVMRKEFRAKLEE